MSESIHESTSFLPLSVVFTIALKNLTSRLSALSVLTVKLTIRHPPECQFSTREIVSTGRMYNLLYSF